MAFKPKGSPDYRKLQSSLVNSKLQQENNAAYQVISNLIIAAQKFHDDNLTKVSKTDLIDLSEQVKNLLPIKNGGSLSGIYTPIATVVSNLNSVTPNPLNYTRVGSQVSVSGIIEVDVIAAVQTEFSIPLPILSYFDFDYRCAGTAISPSGEVSAIYGDVTNNEAYFDWVAGAIGIHNLSFTLSYRIIAQ